MSERAFTSDDEQVNQGTRQPPLSKSGRKAILSVADEAVSIGEVRRLAIHPGGDAPDVFLSAYLQQTATPAVKELALWDVLS